MTLRTYDPEKLCDCGAPDNGVGIQHEPGCPSNMTPAELADERREALIQTNRMREERDASAEAARLAYQNADTAAKTALETERAVVAAQRKTIDHAIEAANRATEAANRKDEKCLLAAAKIDEVTKDRDKVTKDRDIWRDAVVVERLEHAQELDETRRSLETEKSVVVAQRKMLASRNERVVYLDQFAEDQRMEIEKLRTLLVNTGDLKKLNEALADLARVRDALRISQTEVERLRTAAPTGPFRKTADGKGLVSEIDTHRSAAAKMFGVDYADVTDAQREAAKGAHFGGLYGSGADAKSFVEYARQRAADVAYGDYARNNPTSDPALTDARLALTDARLEIERLKKAVDDERSSSVAHSLELGRVCGVLGVKDPSHAADVAYDRVTLHQTAEREVVRLTNLAAGFERNRDTLETLLEKHPRCAKLMRAGTPFFVVRADEPYALSVAALIKHREMGKGTWTNEDEVRFGEMLGGIYAGAEGSAVPVAHANVVARYYRLAGSGMGGETMEHSAKALAKKIADGVDDE